MNIKDIATNSQKTETENDAMGNNIVGYWFYRPCSYFFTWLVLPTSLTPNMLSAISLLWAVIGFVFMCFPGRIYLNIVGVICFMLWAIFDNVDGCVARIKKQFSGVGDLWDAAAGYVAMSLMFLGIGICAFSPFDSYTLIYVILGALTAISALLPRLLMHFKYHGETNSINDKRHYGLIKILAFNITTPDGFVLPLMLFAIFFHFEWFYVTLYFLMYLLICIYTCANLLAEKIS